MVYIQLMLQVQLNNCNADLQCFIATFGLNLVGLYRTLTIFNGCEFSDFGAQGNLTKLRTLNRVNLLILLGDSAW